jgi:fermentation-respiration switch protein FrsA (DUF1100 family)
MAEERFPWAPVFLLKYTFRSDLWMPKVNCPVLIVQGEQDEVIPFSQGKKLAGITKFVTFVGIRDGHHNDLSDFDEYWVALKRFLSRLELL